MSPRRVTAKPPPIAARALQQALLRFGVRVRDTRRARRWSVSHVATRAGISPDSVYRLEAGQPVSLDACFRVTSALGRRLSLELADPRARGRSDAGLGIDLVHSAMAEFEASHLRLRGLTVGIDEPYQHFQFAGRADVVAWDVERRALLHMENKSRFPDLQDAAGAYNAKRAYLGRALAERAGVRSWTSETHVLVGLWSSEVLHSLRLREASFRSLCPDGITAFLEWWAGTPPTNGSTSAFVALDPFAGGRQRFFVGLDDALAVRPRLRGYADAAARLVSAA